VQVVPSDLPFPPPRHRLWSAMVWLAA
jgi:hypothetical protein